MVYAVIGVVLIFLIGIMMYNSIVRKKNQIKNAFAGIDVQLKKRYDLIPNLVATVKEYMQHEKELLTRITELRTKASSPNLSNNEKLQLDQQTNSAMKEFNVAVENYPDLKANTNFVNLQRTLFEVEEQLSAARRFYNSAVTDYNNSIMTFPSNVIASIGGFKSEEVFSISSEERENVSVKDLF
ncbi:LemA family protein [Vallitalea sediminicola]